MSSAVGRARRRSRTKSKKAALVLARARPQIKILVSLYQIIGGIGAIFAIPFPSIYQQIVSVVSGIVSIELPTLFPSDYYMMLLFKTTWPLAAYVILVLLSRCYRKAQKDRHADTCIDYLFLVMFIVYPGISSGVYCVPLEDGTSWLRVDLSILLEAQGRL